VMIVFGEGLFLQKETTEKFRHSRQSQESTSEILSLPAAAWPVPSHSQHFDFRFRLGLLVQLDRRTTFE